jgi:uncharacterized protein YbjT (DUF2867 family)
MRNALIAGASGLIGSRLVDLCGQDEGYSQVHVVTRRPLFSGAADGPIEHVVDFDQLAETDLGEVRIDDVFCALGTTIRTAGSKAAFRRVDQDYVLALGQLALRLGARRFLLVSSLGADPRGSSFYLRVKGEVEADLAGLGLEQLYVFRPSLLKGKRREFRLGEAFGNVAMGLFSPLVPKKLRPVTDETLARAMLAVARDETAAFRCIESDEIQRLGR